MDKDENIIPEGNVTHNIKGAPFNIGEKVKVTFSTDETFDCNFFNCIGKIVYYNYSHRCGQTYPNDPMIGVKFRDGSIEVFWEEELTSVRKLSEIYVRYY